MQRTGSSVLARRGPWKTVVGRGNVAGPFMPRPVPCGKDLLGKRVNDAARVNGAAWGSVGSGDVASRPSVAKRFTAGKGARKAARAGRGRSATPRGMAPGS